ncbi:MAG TPA: nucleoside triphosphate pyrophosphohydrolase [Pyrinomonadaceae bacterium]|nr:nucleoside triphosphate pyrophosphohydrolase [Pyrinomonadaceae bacterium]
MKTSFEELVAVMARLRAPGGCPWDREQTYASLAPYLLEETYEAFDAIAEAAEGQTENLREELGDVLLQVVFHSTIAAEAGDFTIDEVVRGVTEKLVLRHPHVFGEAKIETAEAVVQNWDALKAAERAASGKEEKPRDSSLEDISLNFPALLEAQKLTKKAAKVGFDWENAEQIFDKMHEEIEELRAAMREKSETETEEEIGDLLFVVVNLARHLSVDAETALKRTNRKFRRRFAYIERELAKRGKTLQDSTLDEMDALWNEAKTAAPENV